LLNVFFLLWPTNESLVVTLLVETMRDKNSKKCALCLPFYFLEVILVLQDFFYSKKAFGMGKITQAKQYLLKGLGGQAFGNPFTKILTKTHRKSLVLKKTKT